MILSNGTVSFRFGCHPGTSPETPGTVKLSIDTWEPDKNGRFTFIQGSGQSEMPLYCSSLTCSIQSTTLPSSFS